MSSDNKESTVERLFMGDPDTAPIGGKFGDFVKFTIEPAIEFSLYLIGMITMVVGAIYAIYKGLIKPDNENISIDEKLAHMRILLSETLTLALTFILGAEVVKTFRVGSLYQLIKVALLVVLRQLITYFLDSDVKRLRQEYPALMKK